ncbi:MAG: replicative DNA helicase [Phycisphaeraceae bacterium]|nr:replicative DNA helicase [Phycisphaeraceae bacterium]
MAMNEDNGGFRNGGGGRRRMAAAPPSLQELFNREPPQSVPAEKALLGSMILEPKIITDILGTINSKDDFYKEAHGEIYRALVEIYDRHDAGDLIQATTLLRDRGVLDSCGGEDYLVELANAVPTHTNAPHFARIVAEKAKLRRLIDACGAILYDAYHTGELGPDGAREVLDKAESAIFEIAQERNTSEVQALTELLQVEMERIQAIEEGGGSMTGLSTGYHDMDRMLLGLQPGELLILAARPSMGKTALALNLAEQISTGGLPLAGAPAKRRVPVGFFSLEMSKSSVTLRMLCARARVKSQDLRSGRRLNKQELNNLGMAADDLKEAPIYIDDTPGLTVLNLRARARRMVQQHDVRVLFIDYLQLLTSPGAARESRQMEVSAISRSIKALARELNVPIVCLAQLNRAAEQREGNRPRMSDLRESGSIEQDADVILLLHREDYYHKDDQEWLDANPDRVGLAEVIVAKQRNGPTGVVRLSWNSDFTRFADLDPHGTPPGSYGNIAGAFDVFDAPSPPSDPFNAPPPPFTPGGGGGFSPGKRSGPIDNHRDGGGPDRDDDDDLNL